MTSISQRPKVKSKLLMFMGIFILSQSVAANSQLRVCADPDNLPFSNRKEQGYENKIAAILAKDLNLNLSYFWQKQRQGFIRQTLGSDRCDVILSVPVNHDSLLTSIPYYSSSYTFITLRHRHIKVESFDDEILKTLRIGLQTIGNDGANSPPAHALSKRGIVSNIVGYSMWGDASEKNPQGRIVDAVMKGDVDVAIVWGPTGGYFAKKYGTSLEIELIPDDPSIHDNSFVYDISFGVKKDNYMLIEKLNKSIKRNKLKINNILINYHIPMVQPLNIMTDEK